MRGPWNKYVQREAMRKRIPDLVATRVDKMGFPTPAQEWFSGPLYEPLRDLLSSQKTRERGIYNMDAVLADLDRQHQSQGQGAISAPLFAIAEFELWCRQSDCAQTPSAVAAEG
jgi:asparagine synthase (glutamine-hydrolysing)